MTLEEADRSLAPVDASEVILQVGFNRRFGAGFRAAHDAIVAGTIGAVQVMRSLTRDPGPALPAECRHGRFPPNSAHDLMRCCGSTPALSQSRCTGGSFDMESCDEQGNVGAWRGGGPGSGSSCEMMYHVEEGVDVAWLVGEGDDKTDGAWFPPVVVERKSIVMERGESSGGK